MSEIHQPTPNLSSKNEIKEVSEKTKADFIKQVDRLADKPFYEEPPEEFEADDILLGHAGDHTLDDGRYLLVYHNIAEESPHEYVVIIREDRISDDDKDYSIETEFTLGFDGTFNREIYELDESGRRTGWSEYHGQPGDTAPRPHPAESADLGLLGQSRPQKKLFYQARRIIRKAEDPADRFLDDRRSGFNGVYDIEIKSLTEELKKVRPNQEG